MLRKLRRIWFLTKKVWCGEPIQTWRKASDGRYICDGDCYSWNTSGHGVCTCGLFHHLKAIDLGFPDTTRSRISLRRQHQTSKIMRDIRCETHCKHQTSINSDCHWCDIEFEKLLKEIFSK